MIKILKNNEKYLWTNHVVGKMGYYGLSVGRVLRVINYPKRKETRTARDRHFGEMNSIS